MNTIPSGVYFLNQMSRLAKSADLDGLVSANSITDLAENSDRENSSFSPSLSMYDVTKSTRHVKNTWVVVVSGGVLPLATWLLRDADLLCSRLFYHAPTTYRH